MFSFVARQAIFDENMNTVGYELLFRDSMTNRFPDVTPEYATAQIIVEQFLGAPLGRLKEYSAIFVKEGANKQVISSKADSLIKISRIWADFFPANTSNHPI